MDVSKVFHDLRERMRRNDCLSRDERQELLTDLVCVCQEDPGAFASCDRYRPLQWLLGNPDFVAAFTLGELEEVEVRVPVWWVLAGEDTDGEYWFPTFEALIGGLHRDAVQSGGDVSYAELEEACRLGSPEGFFADIHEQQGDRNAALWEQHYLR